jgi:hypothetical protein
MAMGLILLMLGLAFGVLKPLGARLTTLADHELTDAAHTEINGILKRVAMFTGITHGLWLVVLVLMYWR